MRLSKQESAEPRYLVGVPKTCPRTDCPNPTRGVEWRGSHKQQQYHCIGCWRKFNYGGVVRSWAKQVTPSAIWLQGLPEHERSKPKLTKQAHRSVSPVPAAQQVHGRVRRQAERSVARSAVKASSKSSRTTGTTRGLHAVANSNLTSGPAQLDLERADEVKSEELGAGVTQSQDGDARQASTTVDGDARQASTTVDLVGNGAGEDPGAPASPTWHGLIDLGPVEPLGQFGVGSGASNLLTEPFGEFGVSGGNDFIPQPLGGLGADGSASQKWSFNIQNYENSIWEGEAFSEFPAITERPGTGIIIPVSDDSHYVQGSDSLITASSADPTAEHSVRPEEKAMKISFLRRSSLVYGHPCVITWVEKLYQWLFWEEVVAKKAR